MRNVVMRKVALGDRQLRHSSRDYFAQLRPRFCPPFQRTQLSNRSQRQLYRAAQYRQGPHQINAGTDPRPIAHHGLCRKSIKLSTVPRDKTDLGAANGLLRGEQTPRRPAALTTLRKVFL